MFAMKIFLLAMIGLMSVIMGDDEFETYDIAEKESNVILDEEHVYTIQAVLVTEVSQSNRFN